MTSTAPAAMSSGVRMETEIVRLNLRHTWTTTMSSSAYRETLHVRLTAEGVTGIGEGAPIVRYKESAQSAQAALETVRDYLAGANPWEYETVTAEVNRRIPGEYAAKAALNIALMDWVGKRLNVPLYRLFGLSAASAPLTDFSIGIDDPDTTRRKVLEAEAYPVLKVKVGLDSDEATLAAVRSATNKPLRVDANEGWKTKEEAVRKIHWLESQGVELVEQPLPAHMLEETCWVRSQVHVPIIADEACLSLADIPKLAQCYDGINVKLDKAGGIGTAHRMIMLGKALGMKTMLGCMISSSVSVTAAAHLSPLVDYADLDCNLLLADDPFVGVQVQDGRLVLPEGPGLGLRPR